MDNKINVTGVVSGTDIEAESRIKSDQLLLETIESERIERMEADKYIISALETLGEKYFIIFKRLRKYEVALNFVIGLSVGLLFSVILIALQMLN